MSFVILQAVMKRLEERRRARLFAELGSTMKLPRSGRGRLARVQELADHERPPMIRSPVPGERGWTPARAREGPLGDPGCGSRAASRYRPAPAGRRGTTDEPAREPAVRVLIAPDSFKGSLASVEVARAITSARQRARPGDDAVARAARRTGGEGTLVAVEASDGGPGGRRTRDPVGQQIRARVARRAKMARRHSSRWPQPPG